MKNVIKEALEKRSCLTEWKQLDLFAKGDILGDIAKGSLDELMGCYEHIDLDIPISSLNGATFNEWLLTNPDNKAFEIWKMVCAHYQQSQVKSSKIASITKSSAALVIYANLLERLDELKASQWIGDIFPRRLESNQIYFICDDKWSQNTKEAIKSEITDEVRLNVVMLAALRGSPELIDRSFSFYKKQPFEKSISWYDVDCALIHDDALQIDSFLKVIEKNRANSNYSIMPYLFRAAVGYESIKTLEVLCSKLDSEDRNTSFSILKNSLEMRAAFLKERMDIVRVVYSLEDEKEAKYLCSFETLWECVKKNKYKSVEFIIDKRPEFLEKKGEVFKERRFRKSATSLTWATVNSNDRIVDLLLSKGAKTKTLIDLMKYPVIKNRDGVWKNFPISAERTLLKKVVTVPTNKKVEENSIRGTYL